MKKILILLFYSCIFSFSLSAQVDIQRFDSIAAVKDYCKSIADRFEKTQVEEIFIDLKKVWILPADELNDLKIQTQNQLNMVGDRYGKLMDGVLVESKVAGGILCKLTYVTRYEIHGLRLIFTFYKGGGNKWILNSFKWDDQIMELLENENNPE